MWAYRLLAPRAFELIDTPAPSDNDVADGEAIVRLEAGGICGSDLPFYRGATPRVPGFEPKECADSPPGLPLHEVVGIVVGGRSDLPIGSRVVGWATAANGLAELCVTRASSLAVIGHDRPATEAVALQPLACVIDAVARIPAVAGRTVTVLGLGPIGVLFAHVLKSNDAKQVIGVDVVDRDDIATEWGVDAVVQSTARSHAMRCRESAHLQTDLVIEAIGHQSGTIFDAVDIVAEHGTIYYFGIPDDDYYAFPMESFLRKNGTLMAGYTDEPRRRSALQAAGAYAKQWPGLLSTYVTHVLPVADVSDAFARAATPAPGQLKITLDASEAAVVNPQGIG